MNKTTEGVLYRGTTVELSVTSGNVAIITFDQKDSRVNLLSSTVMDELANALDIMGDRKFAGAVIRSSKPDCFIAGADIKEILKAQSMPVTAAYNGCQDGKKLLDRIRALPYPTVAAIRGRCLGGGAELALACTYRVAVDSKDTVIGLPEVALGVIPGWGGTCQAPRMVGFAAAIPLVINPLKPWSARKAFETGLVTELVPHTELLRRSVEIASGSRVRARKEPSATQRFVRAVGDSAIGRNVLATIAGAVVKVQTRGKYPAPLAALKVMKASMKGDLKDAYDLESRTFAELCHTKASAECVQKFIAYQAAKKEKKSGTK